MLSSGAQTRIMPRQWIATAAAVTVMSTAGLVAGTSTGNAPTARSAAAPTITARLPHHGFVRYRHATTLTGKVTLGGTPEAGVTVKLRSDPYPYGSYKSGPTTTTDAQGGYLFKVSPTVNTHYRVTGPTTSMSPVVHLIELAAFVDLKSTAPGNVVTVHGKLHYPARVHEQGHKLYWYLALNGSQRPRHVTTTRVAAPFKPGWSRFTAHLRTGLPLGVTYRYKYEVLTPDLPHQGIGLNGCTSNFSEDRYPLARSTCTVPAHIHFAPW